MEQEIIREIKPIKLVTNFDKDGKTQNSILLYQLKINGKVDNRFHTISVKKGVDIKSLNKILKASVTSAEKSEKISKMEEQNGLG